MFHSQALTKIRLPAKDSFLTTILMTFAVIILGYALPYYMITAVFGLEVRQPEQQFVNMVARGSIYTLFALGYALVFSILGLLNLAHSSVYMCGAAAGMYIILKYPDLSLLYALPAGMIAGGIIGVLVDWVAFLPLRMQNAPRTSQLISSIGASILLLNLAFIFFIKEFKKATISFPRERIDAVSYFHKTSEITDLNLFGITLWQDIPFVWRPIQLTMFVVAMILMFQLQFLISRTRVGKAMRVVAYNPRTARLLGINVNLVFMFTFFLAGSLAGAAGVLQGINTVVSYDMGNNVALVGLTVIVLGGMGKIQGAVVGSFLVANIETVAIILRYEWLDETALVFVIFFLMLLVRPQGVLGDPIQDRA